MLAVASFLLSTIPTSTQAASFSDGLSAFKEEDYETAFKIWKSVAKKGNPKAQFRLAAMYRKGIGIPKNHKKAIRWFLLAAKQEKSGFSEPFRAQMNLGHYYQMGDAVNENKVIALKWYLSASKGFRHYDFRRGTRISAKMIAKIKKDMSEEEISKAKKLAYQWEEKQKNGSQKMSNMNVFSDALSKLKQKTNTGIELEKKEKNKTKNLLKRKTGTSYLESSRYMHIYKKIPGWDFDPETMTYADGSNRIHLGILKSYEDIEPENLKYIKQIFPLRKGKKFTYNLSRGSSEWQYIAEVKEEYKKKDPHLGEIYCFRIEGTFENKWSSWSREREGIICPVFGMSFQFLETGSTVKIKKEVTTYKKLLSLSKNKTAFRVESKNSKTTLINLFEEKAKQLRLLEVKRKKEQERKAAEIARKKREAELARKKKQAELARKKKAAELARKSEIDRKKREAELARKKKQAELARKKEIARKKLLAKRKLEAKKKRQKEIAAKKRKIELLLKLLPPLSLEANKLSNDIQLFLQKNPDTPNLIEIATLIGKIKQSQKRKEVLRLKKSIKTLRTLLTKVKGFSAFETKRNEARKIARLKLLNKKIKSGKDLKNFLRSYVARNILNDSKTVQKILPVLKNLDASLKSPKLHELKILIPKIQEFILTTSSLKKEVVKLRKKKELEAKRKRELEAKRKRELEAKRKRELEAKQKEADKKRLLAVRKKAKELKRKALSKENKPKKKAPKMDDFQISEIVQKKIAENKFKEAKLYAKKIQDPDIRNLFLQNIELQDKSKSDKKNNIRVKKKKSSDPHLLFGVSSSRDTYEFVEEKNKFNEITYYRYQFGCLYQLNVTNNTNEKVNISMIKLKVDEGIIRKWQGKKASFAFYKLTEPGENIVSQNSAEIYELIHLKPPKKLSDSEIQKRKKRHGCAAQKNKINIQKSFMPFIDFRKGSPLKKIDIFKLIRQTSPLTPK